MLPPPLTELTEYINAGTAPVVYFFCKQNDENRDNPLSIPRTLLWQFLDQSQPVDRRYFVNIIHEVMFKSGTPRADSVLDLWGLLGAIIGKIPAVYCVIDGLEECGNKDELVSFLAQLTALSTTISTVLKTFATYRGNQPRIDKQLASWSSFVINKADTQADIDAFTLHCIKNSHILNHDERGDQIYSSITQGAGGMFLWARLMLDDLDSTSPLQIEDVLSGMPNGLGTVYDLMLQRVSRLKPRPVNRCRKVLHWSAVARQPLSVDELLLALAVSEGLTSHENYNSELDLTRNPELLLIKQECGPLIAILVDRTVRLVHTTLREHLLKETDHGEFHTVGLPALNLPAAPDQAFMSLAMICLKYNMFSYFQDDIGMLAQQIIETTYLFLRYCTCNWTHHVVVICGAMSPTLITNSRELILAFRLTNILCNVSQ